MWGKDGKCHICIPQHGVVNKEANLALTIFAPSLLLSFVTILRLICRENLCRSIFPSSGGSCICHCDMFKNVQNPRHALRKKFLQSHVHLISLILTPESKLERTGRVTL